MEFIKQNLKEVEEKICAACKRAGRDRSEVTLIAVSKTKPVEMLEACIENGITVFGENKVQELLGDTKIEEGRIAAEVVIFADKMCTDEETVRLHSHIKTMAQGFYGIPEVQCFTAEFLDVIGNDVEAIMKAAEEAVDNSF